MSFSASSSVVPAKAGTQGPEITAAALDSRFRGNDGKGKARGVTIDAGPLWIVPPLLVLLGSFFYPLSLIVGQAFTGAEGGFSLETVEAVFASAMFRDAIGHTVGIALAASAGCLALGFVLALILSFVP